MRKHQIEYAAYEVATQVRAVEDSIEAALAEIAELQARIVRPIRSQRGNSHRARSFEQLIDGIERPGQPHGPQSQLSRCAGGSQGQVLAFARFPGRRRGPAQTESRNDVA